MLARGRVTPLVVLAALSCGQPSPAGPARGGSGAGSAAGNGAGSGSNANAGGGSGAGLASGSGVAGSSGSSAAAGSSAGASAGGDASAATGAAASATGDGGSGRAFPDTNATIAILADQFPSMNGAQTQFAATHYVGTEKQLLAVTQALRAVNPNFLVLHYHLSMWQSAPTTDFIVDGTSWGNDY